MELVTIASFAADGRPREQPSRIARVGELARVRPGVYIEPGAWAAMGAEERHVLRMRAAQVRLGDRAVFGSESAALVHGVPLLGAPPDRPCVLVRPRGSRSSSLVRRVQTPWPIEEVVEIDGFVVTTPLRTVVDLAAERSPLTGAIAFSHIRTLLGVPLADCVAALEERRPFRGARRVDRALRDSSAGSQSPLETLVMMRIRDLGFAEPEQQREVVVGGRRYWVDFAWDDGDIVLEADGLLKYGKPGALWDEKEREDAIRTVVRRFGRTSWQEAWAGHGLVRKLLAVGVPRPGRPRPLTY